MHRHEMQQSNIYLDIYIIEYYFFWKNQGVTVCLCRAQINSVCRVAFASSSSSQLPFTGTGCNIDFR
jgi:hypothetical protein